MIDRDQKCVHVTHDLSEANVVVALLGGHGIEGEIMNSVDPWWPEWQLSARGTEVWVRRPEQAADARRLLQAQGDAIQARKLRTGSVEVACEACGKRSTFPASVQGTVQDCPYCLALIDVPDPEEEEWDVGVADEAPPEAQPK